MGVCAAITLAAGCQTTQDTAPGEPTAAPAASDGPPMDTPAPEEEMSAAPTRAQTGSIDWDGPAGVLEVDVTDVLGRALPIRLRLDAPNGATVFREDILEGQGAVEVPAGSHTAYVYVYSGGVPILSEIEEIDVPEGGQGQLSAEILEGSSGDIPLWAFDQDFDMVLDRVEIEAGTDPEDPADIPGEERLPFPDTVLSQDAGWYKGELHARSEYGVGTESVAQLIRRAEQKNLDFLAITDRNTIDSIYDPDYHSDNLVLIPAMEWGFEERGVALIYGPRTFPRVTDSRYEAQGVARLVQAQGGVFAAAHPALPTAPWQWGPSFVNAVQVWTRGWRDIPPLAPEMLSEWSLERRDDGRLIHSVARAAHTAALGANGQAGVFYNAELRRGLKACIIGGSMTGGPQVPIGEPVTYIYAEELSAEALLEGVQMGRTFVSDSPDGPFITFTADVMQNNRIDVGIGGVIPLGVPVTFEVTVQRAQGKKLQVLLNGNVIITQIIDSNNFLQTFQQWPEQSAMYQVRVVDTPTEPGFGDLDVFALTSPIYAHEIMPLVVDPEAGPLETWIRIHGAPGTELDGMPQDTDQIQDLVPEWEL